VVAKARKLSPDSRFAELVDGWLDHGGIGVVGWLLSGCRRGVQAAIRLV